MKPVKNPDSIKSYFLLQKKNLTLVTITGIIYNIGMTAGPYFEGRLAQRLYEIINGVGTWKSMLYLAIMYVCVIFIVQLCRTLKRFFVRRFANDTSRNMRHMLYNSIVHMDKRELEEQKLGTVMTKAIGDVDACVEGMRKFTTEVFDTGVAIVAYAVMLCVYDIRLALFSCVFIPIAYVIAEKCKGVVSHYNEIYKANSGTLNGSTMDLVHNTLTYRVFGLEGKRRDVYEEDLAVYEKSAVKANIWEGALQPIYFIIAMAGSVIIFYFGGKNVLGTGWAAWDIGVFTTFFSCFSKLALKTSKAAKLFNSVQKASVSWKRIKPMFRDYVEDKELETSDVDNLEFKDVSISYPGCGNILESISLDAHRGQIIGITGEIASGKTAIGKALIGEANYQGHITIDKNEQKDIENPAAYITYMGHEPELLSASLADNILLGRDADTSEMEEKLKLVCLSDEVALMPDASNTQIGGGGIRLSGGQQERLALARTLEHASGILVLDDPFSAVDKNTESQIFENLKAISADKIVLLISHRLTFFPQMDKVLFLHDGTATYATHTQLMNSEKAYVHLFETQGGVGNE